MGTKAVRFSESEEKSIIEFLEKNPFLDFSTIARLAILNFIKNPEIKLIPVNATTKNNRNSQSKVH